MLRLTFFLLFTACAANPQPKSYAETDGDRCRGGNGETCFQLAVTARQSGELNALSLFQAACRAGDGLGCVEAGWMLMQGTQQAQAAATYERGCVLGAGRACTGLAEVYERTGDSVQARTLFQRGCDKGDSKGCARLGKFSESKKEAMTLYQRACDGNFASACADLGRAYMKQRDTARARALFQRACDLGDPGGCKQLNELLRDGRGRPSAVAPDFKAGVFGQAADGQI